MSLLGRTVTAMTELNDNGELSTDGLLLSFYKWKCTLAEESTLFPTGTNTASNIGRIIWPLKFQVNQLLVYGPLHWFD